MILRLSLPLLCMGGHFVSAVTLHIEYYRTLLLGVYTNHIPVHIAIGPEEIMLLLNADACFGILKAGLLY